MNKQKNEVQMDLDDYDVDTGEIKEKDGKDVKAFQKPIFRSQWCNPYEPIYQDLSNEYEETFEEIPPYTKDEKGNWLNDTSVPKLVPTGKINIQERIQSFYDDVDIYKILERFAYTGDMGLFNQRESYDTDIDISSIPTNFNDFNDYYNHFRDELSKVNPDIARLILDDKVLSSDIEEKAKNIFNERLNKYNEVNNVNKPQEGKEKVEIK